MPPTTPTTRKPVLGQWPERVIASTGFITSTAHQDVVATSDDVYWLSQPGPASGSGAPVTVYQYNLASGQIAKGPATTGFVGIGALTIADGWVWTVIGVGADVVVKQLNPSSLAVHSTESIPFKSSNSSAFPPDVYPVLTATVNGPLWVAEGADLWMLSPITGAVESEFNAGNEIASVSTDPTGTLLYTGGQTTTGEDEMAVTTEYNARTGQKLMRLSSVAVGPDMVAATNGGVWVSSAEVTRRRG